MIKPMGAAAGMNGSKLCEKSHAAAFIKLEKK
nr:MAG TPA: hypothetical protein [Caudoviricetes sp.]